MTFTPLTLTSVVIYCHLFQLHWSRLTTNNISSPRGCIIGSAPLLPMSSPPASSLFQGHLWFWYVSNIVVVGLRYTSNDKLICSFVSLQLTNNPSCFVVIFTSPFCFFHNHKGFNKVPIFDVDGRLFFFTNWCSLWRWYSSYINIIWYNVFIGSIRRIWGRFRAAGQ